MKKRIYNEDPKDAAKRQSGLYTLYHCMKAVCTLFAPFIPHVTDEINECLFDDAGSLQLQYSWPLLSAHHYDSNSITAGEDTLIVLELIRKFKCQC